MQNELIRIENLTKKYKLYNKPIDRLKEVLNPFGRKYHKDFYALKDISFSIKKGEIVGIIGKNGSGKSTLLKIISGVLKPSSGKVQVNGKVSALLELGTGFHPELSGMENIFLYGSIMGISKSEMKKKVNDIIEFADIGEFINRPVKMYSSGMFARLAFSVAIHIEPEILIVDEVLSVGDISFQYKCFKKFNEFKEKGVTILFVTHSMGQILTHCDRALFLKNGKLIRDSYDVESVVTEYEKFARGIKEEENKSKENVQIDKIEIKENKEIGEKRFGTHRAVIYDIFVSKKRTFEKSDNLFKSGEYIYLNFLVYSYDNLDKVVLGVSIRNKNTADIWGDNNLYAGELFTLKKGFNKISYKFKLNINEGEYLIFAGLARLGETREELDQRWPIEKIKIVSTRRQVGWLFSPIEIIKD
jgi:lipopolysaccharide transport system ATP-binding protein